MSSPGFTSQLLQFSGVPKITLEVVDVSFSAIRDPKERAYFMHLSAIFVLADEDIDRLVDVAR